MGAWRAPGVAWAIFLISLSALLQVGWPEDAWMQIFLVVGVAALKWWEVYGPRALPGLLGRTKWERWWLG